MFFCIVMKLEQSKIMSYHVAQKQNFFNCAIS